VRRGAFAALLALACAHSLTQEEKDANFTREMAEIRSCERAGGPGWFRWPASAPAEFRESPFMECWAASELQHMGESLLLATPPDTEVYRFTWLRSFHEPIVVRVERRGSKSSLIGVVGSPSSYPKEIRKHVSRALSPLEWEAVQAHFVEAHFWPPTPLHRYPGEAVCVDGAVWIFEGVRHGNYRALSMSCDLERNPSFKAAGLRLIELAGLMPPTDEIY
jgi:hypothetical protein